MKPLDPVTLEVIRNALTSIAEEMSMVVMRAARSPLLREAGDHSSALADGAGLLVAQGQDVPVHLGVMSFTVGEFLKLVPMATLMPGDVWILNMPSVGGNHLPDVKVIRPVFAEARVVAFAVSLAHWADIGGAAPGSYYAAARDIWQEGLRIPPMRLATAAGLDEEKLGIILANVRGPAERRGDVLAQVAATRVAERRLHEMVAAYGADTIKAAFAGLHDRAERQMRDVVRAIPDGTYRGEDFLDDDGHGGPPVAIRVCVTVMGEAAEFDFSESADAVSGPLNTTPFVAAASVFYAMRALYGADIQPSAGCYRPLKVLTRPGSVLDPAPTAPVVGGNHETCQRVADAIFQAFAAFAPERLSAGGPTTAGLLIFGARRTDGEWSTLYEVHGGGEGARHDRDGMAAVRVHMANVANTPAEVIEAEYPLRIEFQTIRAGSGGAGRYRGGDGFCRGYRVLADGVSLTTMVERAVVPPYGLLGGEPGAPFQVTLERRCCAPEILPGKTNVMVNAGDLVVIRTSGGGGYGVAG